MPELRFDHTTADWVVFAPLRGLRPHSKQPAETGQSRPTGPAKTCPFCPGNEAMSPLQIDFWPNEEDRSLDWSIRVVPNKFPALQIEETNTHEMNGTLFRKMGGCGAHEVVVESAKHDSFIGCESSTHVANVVRVLHRRYVDLMRDNRFQAVIVFKNHRESAGTSLEHPHWQIVATPVVPRTLRLKHIEATNYYDRTGRCLYDTLLGEERAEATRIVTSNQEFTAFMPFASHLPFETWIVPHRHQASFAALANDQITPLADIIKDVLLKLYVGLDDPAFNLTIDTAVRGEEDQPIFRWHIRILPRLTTTAGFELGSGMSINTVLPEEAAQFLTAGNSASSADQNSGAEAL